jgi:hypothetical protein
MSGPIFDDKGRFQGHEPNEGCEHRTVGSHRAWCYNCNEWCYPDPEMACVRCERAWKESVELERVRVYDRAGEPHDIVLRTKTGRVLTGADVLALAEQDEQP